MNKMKKWGFVGFLIVCALMLGTRVRAGATDKTLDIYWPDIEGGGATLIVTPTGESILVDTGLPGQRDPGRIHKLTQLAGLKKIDHLIVTHFDDDHYGGTVDLSKLIPIGHLYDNGVPNYKGDNVKYHLQEVLDGVHDMDMGL